MLLPFVNNQPILTCTLQYVHLDGGKYRGEWLGMLKQGYGVYTYPSGAKYEGGCGFSFFLRLVSSSVGGEGIKQGYGVYTYPSGAQYESGCGCSGWLACWPVMW